MKRGSSWWGKHVLTLNSGPQALRGERERLLWGGGGGGHEEGSVNVRCGFVKAA